MSENCDNMSCDVPNNAVQDYLLAYSLNRVVVRSVEYTTIINGIPYTVPADTFSYPLSPNSPPQSPLSFQGCQSMITVPIPVGSTFEQIQALVQGMLQQAAAQQAQCDAASGSPINPLPQPIFLNQSVTAACLNFPAVNIIGSPNIPFGIVFENFQFTVTEGIFSSTISQLDANNNALNFLRQLIAVNVANGNLQCGWVNEQQTVPCEFAPDSTIAARTYFSAVSQADANQQAIDAATAACPTVYWNNEQSYTCCDGSNLTVPAHTYHSIISQEDADAPASAAIAAFHANCPQLPPSSFVWFPVSGDFLDKSTITSSAAGGNASISADYTSPDVSDNGYTIAVLTTQVCNDNPPRSYHIVINGNVSAYGVNPSPLGSFAKIRVSTNLSVIYDSAPSVGSVFYEGDFSTSFSPDFIYVAVSVCHGATHAEISVVITPVT
jgi:hypothetical protein